MSAELPDHLLGSTNHKESRDLSNYLVHMTRSAESLASIVLSGHIEAREAFGMGRGSTEVKSKHTSACFTEMPLNELKRLRGRGKHWGIAFKKDFVERQGGQRVWYLGSKSVPFVALESIKDSAIKAGDWDNPVWNLTSFVDNVDPNKYAFDWEREWRIVGGLQFELEDVVLLIGPDGSKLLFHEEFSIGAPLYDPRNDTYEWCGETIPTLGANLEVVLARFHQEYASPDEAGLFPSTEPGSVDGYWWRGCATRHETEDALWDLLPKAPVGIHSVLSRHLNGISPSWAHRSELDTDTNGEDSDPNDAVGAN